MPDQSSAASEHAILQEITGPLGTLPDDPVALVHADFPTAMRGYERAAVDDYVQQMSQLVAELQATRSPEAAVRRALERVGEQISGILQRAHDTAEQITAQSRREAEDRLDEARAEATQIAGAAEQRVKDLDGDTDRIWLERQRIVADAEDLASQLVALARSAAERFPADEDADEDADEIADDTAPYDEEEVPTVAPPPTFGDEQAPVDEPEPEAAPASASASELAPAEEIEQTVAFQPLAPREDHPGASDEPPGPGADSESTTVIPPASQAGSRRRPRP